MAFWNRGQWDECFSASYSMINPCFTAGKRIVDLKLSRNLRTSESDRHHVFSLWLILELRRRKRFVDPACSLLCSESSMSRLNRFVNSGSSLLWPAVAWNCAVSCQSSVFSSSWRSSLRKIKLFVSNELVRFQVSSVLFVSNERLGSSTVITV